MKDGGSKRFVFIKLVAIALLASLCAPIAPVVAAEESTVEVSLNDSRFGYWLDSKIFGYTFKPGTTEIADRLNCDSWTDSKCVGVDQMLAELIMRPCLQAADRGCIESVGISDAGKISAEPLRFLGEGEATRIPEHRFNGKKSGESYFVPAGGGVSIWESDEKTPAGTPRRYMAHVLTRYSYFCGDLSKFVGDFAIAGTRDCEIATIEFKGSVIPVTLSEKDEACQFFTLGEQCVEPSNFSGDERVEMTLRQEKSRTGWLFGRMKQANFSLSSLDADFNRVSLAGDVTFVPALKAVVLKSDIARFPRLESYLRSRFNGQSGQSSYQDFMSQQRTIIDPQIYDLWEIFDAFEENLKPVPSAASRTPYAVSPLTNSILWNFASAIYDGSDLHPCSADKTKLHGLVVTNSPLYASGPPKFQQGSLDYQVAGVHKNEDGSVFRGFYTFVVRSDTARCFYGFTSAPIQASVSVISSDGNAQVATTTVNEGNGFLTLAANGFTFSSPKIRATLTQLPKKKASSKEVIKCKKGKKIVTLSKSRKVAKKCPDGYRLVG